MFMSLISSLQADITLCMHKFNADLQAVVSRVQHVETKMRKFATTYDDLIDAHEWKDEDIP